MMTFRKVKVLAQILILIGFTGCAYFASWDDLGESWVGNDMTDILDLWGEPDDVVSMDDGNKEYKYWLKDLDPTCVHYWIVNPQGTITGFRYEGWCQQI